MQTGDVGRPDLAEEGGGNGGGNGSDKQVTIYVNADVRLVAKEKLTFDELVALASGLATGPNVKYAIRYRRGRGQSAEHILSEGQDVQVQDGMVFSVTATDRS